VFFIEKFNILHIIQHLCDILLCSPLCRSRLMFSFYLNKFDVLKMSQSCHRNKVSQQVRTVSLTFLTYIHDFFPFLFCSHARKQFRRERFVTHFHLPPKQLTRTSFDGKCVKKIKFVCTSCKLLHL
jgi:hypothetical protein